VEPALTLRRLLLACALLTLAFAAAAAEWTVGDLMQSLARQQGGRVAFVERKHIAILDRPVESSGELVYRPPARLEKRTLRPQPELLVLDGDELSIQRGKQTLRAQLRQYPEAGAFIDSIRGTLAGDLGALQRRYRLVLHGTEERWQLTLLPSDPAMGAVVLRIQIAGRRNQIQVIETMMADGDRSVLTIEPVAGR
jgi:outer membrane lipoprotein-sorting protein